MNISQVKKLSGWNDVFAAQLLRGKDAVNLSVSTPTVWWVLKTDLSAPYVLREFYQ